MAAGKASAKARLMDVSDTADSSDSEPQAEDSFPTLVVGDKTFVCKTNRMPFGTMLRYAQADMDLFAVRGILLKVIRDEDVEAVWDAFDEVGAEGASEAIQAMLGQFSERPTKKP